MPYSFTKLSISDGKPGQVHDITAYVKITNKTIVEKILDILGKSAWWGPLTNESTLHPQHWTISWK